MADTIREQIIKAFTANVQVLSGLEVERVRRSMPEGKERFISVWDGEGIALENQFGTQAMQFPIAVECIFDPDMINPSISANTLIGEIFTAVMGGDRSYGGIADRTEVSSITPEYPADGSGLVTVTAIFLISYTTVLGDPFTNP